MWTDKLKTVPSPILRMRMVKKNISQGKEREREVDNVQFLRRSPSPMKEIACTASLLGGSKVGYCCLSIKILNIFYYRHGPKIGF